MSTRACPRPDGPPCTYNASHFIHFISPVSGWVHESAYFEIWPLFQYIFFRYFIHDGEGLIMCAAIFLWKSYCRRSSSFALHLTRWIDFSAKVIFKCQIFWTSDLKWRILQERLQAKRERRERRATKTLAIVLGEIGENRSYSAILYPTL